MEKGPVRVYFGESKGKTAAAVGRAVECAAAGKDVFIIQFLKGKTAKDMGFYRRLEPEVKLFRFEKEAQQYETLSNREKEDERVNIINGVHFAKKVLAIGECDVIVLDEVLGLADIGIIAVQDIIDLIKLKGESTEMILTGRVIPEEIMPYCDQICEMTTVKGK